MKTYKITDWLMEDESKDEDEREIIHFGIRQGILMLFNIITTLCLGIIFQVLWQSILFLISFSILRSYAGGYHADTKLRCYFSSVFIIIISFSLLRSDTWTNSFCFLVSMISTIIIFILAPVGNSTKPLDKKEVEVYKQKARYVLVVENIILIIAIVAEINIIYTTLSITFIIIALLLILGKVKYEYYEKN